MAAVLTLTMDRSRLTYLVVSFVFCMHLVKSTMSLDITTRHDFGMHQSRKRRQDKCSESGPGGKEMHLRKYDRNAVHEISGGQSASTWCTENTNCTGYVVSFGKAFYSTSTNHSFINNVDGVYTFTFFRCPIRFRCRDSPCNNGGTCVPPSASGQNSLRCDCTPQWIGWYCENLKNMTCEDDPCKSGETCYNSTITGFACTSTVTSTTPIVTSTNTIVTSTTKPVTSTTAIITSTTTPNKTMDGGGLSTDTKVVIAAAAVGGVVVTGVAAAAVVSATSSAAATTTAGATGGQ